MISDYSERWCSVNIVHGNLLCADGKWKYLTLKLQYGPELHVLVCSSFILKAASKNRWIFSRNE